MVKTPDPKEIFVRFSLGGAAVAVCYIISVYSPVKFIGGVFAAFPAVMAASVAMAGLREGDAEAADVARGAVSGMIGCTACVVAALYLIRRLDSWALGLTGGIAAWFVVSVACNLILPGHRGNQKPA